MRAATELVFCAIVELTRIDLTEVNVSLKHSKGEKVRGKYERATT